MKAALVRNTRNQPRIVLSEFTCEEAAVLEECEALVVVKVAHEGEALAEVAIAPLREWEPMDELVRDA